MRLELYTAGVSQVNLSNWEARFSEDAQAVGIEVAHSSIRETPEVLREKLPVVLDELCSIPEQRVEFRAADVKRLCSFAYANYRSRMDKDWNVSLYFPSKGAIFLPFDETLLSRWVATPPLSGGSIGQGLSSLSCPIVDRSLLCCHQSLRSS